MGDTAMHVPVDLRTHEVNQLQEMVPDAAQQLRETDVETLVEDAETLERAYDEHLYGLDGPGVASMPADDWRAIVRNLDRADDGLRVWWLRKKLVDRLSDVQRLADTLERVGK
jgi:hypothetical protein